MTFPLPVLPEFFSPFVTGLSKGNCDAQVKTGTGNGHAADSHSLQRDIQIRFNPDSPDFSKLVFVSRAQLQDGK